jgi:hypothetical protein
MTLIASHTTASGGEASYTFSSIPGTYTDLLFRASARSDRTTDTNDQIWVRFNGDSASNYPNAVLLGNGSALDYGLATATAVSIQTETSAMTANIFTVNDYYIPNYTNTSFNKTASADATTENNATLSYITISANQWSNTSAITSITVSNWRGNFTQYSTFYLYGIKNS